MKGAGGLREGPIPSRGLNAPAGSVKGRRRPAGPRWRESHARPRWTAIASPVVGAECVLWWCAEWQQPTGSAQDVVLGLTAEP